MNLPASELAGVLGVLPIAAFSPGLAAGAAAAAVVVPIVIHLLFRKRYRVVPWAAVRFLIGAEKRNRRRIEQWLLLALRILVVLLPLAAMAAATSWAEPLWQSVKPGALESVAHAPRTHHVLILDASFSMAARGGDAREGATRFERAKALLQETIDLANTGDGFSLIVQGESPEVVVPGPSNDAGKVTAELEKLQQTHGSPDPNAVLAVAADVLARSPRAYPRRQVTLATDLQRSSWGSTLPRSEESRPDAWQKLLSRADVAVLDVAGADVDNLAVVDVASVNPLPLVGSPIVVTATVKNFGRSERQLVDVVLEVERPAGTVMPPAPSAEMATRRIETLPPGGQASVTFALAGLHAYQAPGLHVARVRLAEGDQLVEDDRRSLVVDVREVLKAVLVNGRSDPEPKRRSSEYLSRALAPPGARPGLALAKPRTLTPSEFADPAIGDLSDTDCVFLCDVPTITPAMVARLESHLKRGGGVVIGLGPNSAAQREEYNRLLFAEGNGLLPGTLGEVVSTAPNEAGFRLAAESDAFQRPPLAAFASDAARAGLATVPVRSYVRLEAPSAGRGERLLSFVPALRPAGEADPSHPPDPAVVTWPRHRGRVVVLTTTFNAEWTDWPLLPSYLPFVHEVLRFASSAPDHHNLQVGDAIEEFFPSATVGLMVSLEGPGRMERQTVSLREETGSVLFAEARLSGEYRLGLGAARDRIFAVHVASANFAGGSESDLHRLGIAEMKRLGNVQVVASPASIRPAAEADGGTIVTAPRPWGPAIARTIVIGVLGLFVLELLLAWRLGPARSQGAGAAVKPVARAWWLRFFSTILGTVVLALGLGALAIWVHSEWTGQLLGFLPAEVRKPVEEAAGVPLASPGEGTRWRLEGFTAFVRGGTLDRQITFGLAVIGAILIVAIYLRERRAVDSGRRVVLPAMLRLSVLLVTIFLVLPQLRLAFDREGWPDVVILLDTSASMSTVDDLKDPAVKAKAAELAQLAGLTEVQRLRLAQILLTRPEADWLDRLLTRRQVKVHVYTIADQARRLASAEELTDAAAVREAMKAAVADGPGSRLGDGVEAVLKAFRGGSLAAMILFTDGVTTEGNDLTKAGREAARDGVPLFLVGVGDAREKPNLILSDLQAEEVVTANDEMVIQARLTARGPEIPAAVPVVLYEKRGDGRIERARTSVLPDASGNPVPFELRFTPTEPGERTFVIEVPQLAGETDLENNRLERVVIVTESRRARVLLIAGYPRYEYRFLKALLERETDARGGSKAVDLKVLLLDASRGWAETDRSAIPEFPTRDLLFEYDVVILGDVIPQQFARPVRALQDLADFVTVRGGGLLFIAGEHAGVRAYGETALADVLPITPTDQEAPRIASDSQTIVDGYRLQPSATGLTHPLFRFAPSDDESRRIGAALQPMFWFATGYKRKLSAEVLATHPGRPADDASPGELHPLVLQQFAGTGRVLFFGFDETWRWRWRLEEEHFNRFWKQAIRILSRSRIGRIELRTDKQTPYRRDEKITVTVRFPDDAPAPPADAAVRVAVQYTPTVRSDGSRGDAETSELRFTRVEGSRATFQATLTRTPEGAYQFWLTEPETPAPRPRAEAKVLPPRGELDELDLDRAGMLRAAAESHGKFYTIADADQVIDDLPDVPRVPLNQPCPPLPLWNQPLMYALLAALLVSEWLLRKRERLL